MSTWAARYVRLGDRARDMARLRALVDAEATVVDDGASPFAGWLVPSPSFQPEDLSSLSRDFGEAVGLAVQTVADLVLYDHFVAGTRVRGLTYAGEAGWVRVVGTPEPWEADALFSATKLERLLEQLDEDVTDDAVTRDKAELEQLWKVGALQEGSARPPADPVSMTRAIEKHFQLPARPKA
jgi:hypothetical protein